MPDERTTIPYAALLLRVSLGLAFLAHGAVLKLGTFGLAGTTGYFGAIGYPPLLGAIVAFAETAAGLALIAGFRVRAVSLLALPILIGATVQHLPNGWLFSSQGGGWEFPALWSVLLLVQARLGAGALAFDPRRPLGRAGAPTRAAASHPPRPGRRGGPGPPARAAAVRRQHPQGQAAARRGRPGRPGGVPRRSALTRAPRAEDRCGRQQGVRNA
ncbi:DoxX family protein [Caldovatus aquaticus]|uniref:DoxX family protein n=1 Tax=Caldovatus aquaticus TaxID=2865671 RepID=A0ABS7F1L4_9PROT|nr:DoxX family protein [Caldovatus aquaticus]